MTASHYADFPSTVDIVVEIPRGSRNEYEFDEETRAADGDDTDALLIIDEPTFTGCHVWARPIGGLEMSDEHGCDFKVLKEKETEVVGWRDRDRALEVLREDRARWGREQAR